MSKQTAIDWLIEKVKSKEWQDMFIWHKDEVFKQAKAMFDKQTEQLNTRWAESREQAVDISMVVGFSKGFDLGLTHHDNYYDELEKSDLPQDVFHQEYINKIKRDQQ